MKRRFFFFLIIFLFLLEFVASSVSVNIYDKQKVVSTGEVLRPQITIVQIGKKETTGITISYVIKDLKGNSVLTKDEKLFLVDKQTFTKDLETLGLSTGDYVMNVEVSYEGGRDTDSSNFEVIRDYSGIFDDSGIIILGAVIFVFIFAIIMVIFYKKQHLKYLFVY